MCVGRADKVGLHVVNSALGVHQILILLSFDLNHSHDYAVNHVDGLTLVVLAFDTLLVVLYTFPILIDVVLNNLAVLLLIDALLAALVVVLKRRLALIDTRLEINIVELVLRTSSAIFVAVLGLHLHLLQLILLRVSSEVYVIGV